MDRSRGREIGKRDREEEKKGKGEGKEIKRDGGS
jgi:hypothetical protein